MLIILFNNMFLYDIMYLIMFFQVNYLDISILFKVTNIYNGIKHTFFSYTLMQWFSLQPYQHLPVFYF